MKNFFLFLAVALFLVSAGDLRAEDAAAVAPAKESASSDVAAAPASAAPAVSEEVKTAAPQTMPEVPAASAVAPAPVAATPVAVAENAAVQEPVSAEPAADNLEFISGEISALDEASKTLTVKLYGESESAAADKTLSVKVDSTTDITDGEKDRDLRSLTAGTEVDVEYDPATKKATYIFVY